MMAQLGLRYNVESGSFPVKIAFIDGETIQVNNAVRYQFLIDDNVCVVHTAQGAPLLFNLSQVKYIGEITGLDGAP